jgi:ribosomal protein S18 acetylase RimI-like enzyme
VTDLLDRIDAYCDAVPRSATRPEEIGPLVLFVPEPDAWPYYARPRRGGADPSVEDVLRVRERQRELGLPEAFEWVDDVTPGLREVARTAGVEVTEHPLMVLRQPQPATTPDGVDVRLVTADDDLRRIGAVAEVGFSNPGTARGEAGAAELQARSEARPAAAVEFARERIRRELTVMAAAWVDGVPVATGMHQPVDDVTEVVGVATLPAFRRRGLGAVVTGLLVEDARARGAETIFLTAGDDEIARVYGRLGFSRVGTSCIAAARTL